MFKLKMKCEMFKLNQMSERDIKHIKNSIEQQGIF